MHDCPPDLLAILAQARARVSDDRLIWCSASDDFDSRVVQRRGLLLGGTVSPHFLRDTAPNASGTPWTVRLSHCRIVACNRAAHEPVQAWLPLMEAIARAGESLLVVTDTIGSELLHTFAVNALRATLSVCVVRPMQNLTGGFGASGSADKPPAQHDRLPRMSEAWIRRTATALFPAAGEIAVPDSTLQNFTLIETGGENYDDQQARLRFLMHELQQS